MQKVLLLVSSICIIACIGNKNKDVVDYYSPVKSQLKEYIISTKCQDIRICLPDSFVAYQGYSSFSGVDNAFEELWYKSNQHDCSIHIKIFKNGKSFNLEEINQQGISNIKVEYPEALIYTKKLTNDKDTIYYLNFIGRQQVDDRNIAYVNFSCGIIRNDMVYSIGLDAVNVGHIIDFELYDEIMNSIRIVD